MVKRILAFFTSRTFWVQLAIAAVLTVVGFIVLNTWLRNYTNHGEVITLEDLENMPYEEATRWLHERGLRDTIIDSSFVADAPPLLVVEQDPRPGSKVKENRMIYLSVTSNRPPSIALPDELIGKSRREVESKLMGTFTLGESIEEPGYENTVLRIEMDGEPLREGQIIPKFSELNLVIGNGLGDTRVPVPCLLGLTLDEAGFVLLGESLLLGSTVYDSIGLIDSSSAIIVKQFPACSHTPNIRVGEAVDVFLQQDMPPGLIDSIQRFLHPALNEDSTALNDTL